MVAVRVRLARVPCRPYYGHCGAWWLPLPHLDCVAHAHTGDGRLLGRRQRRGEADEAVLRVNKGEKGDNNLTVSVRHTSCARPPAPQSNGDTSAGAATATHKLHRHSGPTPNDSQTQSPKGPRSCFSLPPAGP